MADPKDLFDAQSFLQDSGLTLVGPSTRPGTVEVMDQEGNKSDFAMQAFLRDNGIANADVQYNTPETAVPASPVGVWDRFKLAIGNDKGRANFLRKNFDDVAYDPEQGLKVKNKGIWQQIDPAGLGIGSTSDQAWELAKDVIDWTKPVGATAASAAAASAALPSGPGALAAAAAGGAAAEAGFTSLGRLVGTYDATPEEQLKDIAFETALSAGGQVLGAGVKAGSSWLKGNLKNLGKGSSSTKEVLSQAFSATTGTAPGAFNVAMDHPDEVVRIFDAAKASGLSAGDISTKFTAPAAQEFLEMASKELPNKFRGAIQSAINSAKPGSTVNMANVVENFGKNVEALGLGVFDEAGRLMPLSEDQIARRVAQGLETPAITDELFKNLQHMSAPLKAFRKTGEVPAPKAVELLSNLNRSINQVADQFASNAQDATNRRFAGSIKNAFKSSINPELDRIGAADSWRQAMQLYGQYGDAVFEARKLMNSEKGLTAFGEQLLADSRAGRNASGLAKTLIDLTGPQGQASYNRIIQSEAARQLSPWIPKFAGARLAAATGVATGAATGGIDVATPEGMGALGLAATFASPRAAFNTIRYALKTKEFIAGMGAGERAAFLQNPAAAQAVFRIGYSALANQENEAQEMLRQAGVVK